MDMRGRALFNLLTFVVIIYFLMHSIYGSRGVIGYFRVKENLAKSKKELELMQVERVKLENKTKLLHPTSLDLDIIEEQSKHILGIAGKEELILHRK